MKIAALAGVTALFLWLASSAGAQVPKEKSLSVSIALYKGKSFTKEEDHFHVVLTNISEKPIRLWGEWNSWGFFNLSFVATDESGAQWVVKRDPSKKSWTRNFPSYVSLEKGEHLVIDVHFIGGDWENPPLPEKGSSKTVKLRACYESKDSGQAQEHHVWIGKEMSEEKECTFNR